MPKLCIKCSEYPVFSHKHCKFCQKYRKDDKFLNKLLKPKNSISKKKSIPLISNKRANELKLYRELRDKFMSNNPYCKICGKTSTDLHHKRGRLGKDLIDARNFLALCRTCHNKIEENPKWSKENGYSEDRLR